MYKESYVLWKLHEGSSEDLPKTNGHVYFCNLISVVFTGIVSKELFKGTMGNNASLHRCGFVRICDPFPEYNFIMF